MADVVQSPVGESPVVPDSAVTQVAAASDSTPAIAPVETPSVATSDGSTSSAPASSADLTPAPAADSGTVPQTKTDQRVANAQRMMTQATMARAELEKQLERLGIVPVTRQAARPTVTPAAPDAVRTQSPVAGLALTPEQIREIHTKYTGAATDEEATGILVQEVMRLVADQIANPDRLSQALLQSNAFVDGTYQKLQARVAEAQTNTQRVQEIEGFWKKHAPNVPTELIWSFANEATQAKPGNLTDQALYMLERAVSALGPLLGEATNTAQVAAGIHRGQAPNLPGGTAVPAGGGTGDQPKSFYDQLRSMPGV